MSTTERLARSLLLYAARSAPPALSERLAEEWLADFEARRGGWARLRHALGCCWATGIIAREHGGVAVAAAPAGAGAFTHYGPSDSPLFSRRALALGLIACLHVGLIWALANGLLQRMIEPAPPDSMQTTLLPAEPRSPPPLPPDPTLRDTVIHVPQPVVDLVPPPPVDPGRIKTSLIDPPVAPPPHGTAQAVKRVLGGPGHGFPNTSDYYPPQAIRMNEQGGTSVSVCVDDAGRLSSAPTLAQSSGSALLDAAALKLARAGSGHYQPTTEDGRAVSSCYSFRIRFALP
jgi:periplasmic protein TonB